MHRRHDILSVHLSGRFDRLDLHLRETPVHHDVIGVLVVPDAERKLADLAEGLVHGRGGKHGSRRQRAVVESGDSAKR